MAGDIVFTNMQEADVLLASASRRCPVCAHRDRAAIEAKMSSGTSKMKLARSYGLTRDALFVHRRSHRCAGEAGRVPGD
jgi:hypothetical protein